MFHVPHPNPLRSPDVPADDVSPVRPIGPERLRALREAILSGTYPLDSAVASGLTSLMTGGRGSDSPRAAALRSEPPESGPTS